MRVEPQSFLNALFKTAVAAVDPRAVIAPFLPPPPKGRLIVLGAGKGSGAMARAAENHYGAAASGLVVTRDGYRLPTQFIEVIEAAHPIPDPRSMVAAQRILEIAQGAGPDDLVLCLLSGGASALMCLPADGLSFADKQSINQALLKSGATIDEMNCVRKHLSQIKGGRLALACAPAKVISLIISDVVGDDISVIASGPTVADPTTCDEALAVLEKYAIVVPDVVLKNLRNQMWETPKSVFGAVKNIIIARPRDAFEAAIKIVTDQGLACLDLGDHHDNSAEIMAADHAARVRRIVAGQDDIKAPCVILSGGEAVVRVTGQGRGGPNTEFALRLALELKGLAHVYALSCDSDGTDGNGHHAGAMIMPDTLQRAAALGLNAAQALAANDTATFFEALSDLVVTGPTLTNVNDIRAILILEQDHLR